MTLAWTLARRELRAGLRDGLRGFRIFLACLILGVAAIAAVGTVRASIQAGLAAEGAALMGGDAVVRFTYRFATDEERAWMDGVAVAVSTQVRGDHRVAGRHQSGREVAVGRAELAHAGKEDEDGESMDGDSGSESGSEDENGVKTNYTKAKSKGIGMRHRRKSDDKRRLKQKLGKTVSGGDKGALVRVQVRLSDRASDLEISVGANERVKVLIAKVKEKAKVRAYGAWAG